MGTGSVAGSHADNRQGPQAGARQRAADAGQAVAPAVGSAVVPRAGWPGLASRAVRSGQAGWGEEAMMFRSSGR
jgi:hypothetical protein